MFAELEGIDIEPAAGVALACLRSAIAEEKVGRDSVVLLNITGGGRLRRAADHPLVPAEPQLRLTTHSLTRASTPQRIADLCAVSASTM